MAVMNGSFYTDFFPYIGQTVNGNLSYHPTYLTHHMRHYSVHQTKLKDDLYQSLPHGTIKLDFIAFCREETQTYGSLKVWAAFFI